MRSEPCDSSVPESVVTPVINGGVPILARAASCGAVFFCLCSAPTNLSCNYLPTQDTEKDSKLEPTIDSLQLAAVSLAHLSLANI